MKKLRKLNTELYYRQHKYNLLQEESQGYAKLITLLFSSKVDDITSDEIRAHIGAFDLDPNRVLDLMLDLLELNIESEEKDSILRLLQSCNFDLTKIPALFMFQLNSLASNET